MNGTLVRILSAVAALVLLFAIAYWIGLPGIRIVALIAIAMGAFEYIKMAFPNETTPVGIRSFALFMLPAALVITQAENERQSVLTGVYATLSVTMFLWGTRNKDYSNSQILEWFSKFFLGFIYFIFLPSFVLLILKMEYATVWFTFLLLVVFAGDTFAYFGGRFLGKKKLMPQISPKKTVAGAWSGVIGSVVCGVALMFYLMPQLPWYMTAVMALLCGFTAQAGDLFVSLVKRVANVKDSGAIMPGHGGVLDRLDGIYIAAPMVYYFAVSWKVWLPI